MKYIIFLFSLCISLCCYSQKKDIDFEQTVDSLFRKFNIEKANINNEFYQKLLFEIKKDSLFAVDRNGNPSNDKFYQLFSKLILEEQVVVLKLMAERTLTNSEFEKFKKMNFEVDYRTKVDMPIVSYKQYIYYDNSSVWDMMIRIALYRKNLNFYEKQYYLTALLISNEIVPDFMTDLLEFRNGQEMLLNLMQQSYVMFFITMHEFYHMEYDNVEEPILNREIKADNYALEQCLKLIEDESSDIEKDIKKLSKEWSINFFDNIKNSKCNYERLVNEKVQLNEFSTMFIGIATLNILMDREMLTFLVTPQNFDVFIKRISNQYKQAINLAHCREGQDNTICCALNNNYQQMKYFKMPFSVKKDIEIDKDKFINVNKDEPSIISFQLGYYYWTVNDKQKAVEYLKSANLFKKNTPMKLLCNMVLCDIYLYDTDLYDKEKAEKYYRNAQRINKQLGIIRSEMFEKYNKILK